jgi:hypothetical protein
MKVCFYLLNSLVENDEETQRRGCVGIVYNLGPNRSIDQSHAHALWEQLDGIPIRFDCVHYMYDTEETDQAMTAFLTTADDRTRVRFRLHFGTSLEDCKLSLLSVGLPVSVIPVDGQEDFDVYHRQWMKEQEAREKHQKKKNLLKDNASDAASLPTLSAPADAPISIPSQYDVLLGKHALVKEHSGNLRYWALLDDRFGAYQVADKTTKTSIAELLIEDIKSRGGRFLRKEEKGWVEITQLEARNKVVSSISCIFIFCYQE